MDQEPLNKDIIQNLEREKKGVLYIGSSYLISVLLISKHMYDVDVWWILNSSN